MDSNDDQRQGSPSRIRRLEPSANVVGQQLGDELVLVNLQTSRIFELNRTSGRFWELLQSESDRSEIEKQLRGEFDVSEAILATEIDELVERLEAEDLVRVLERD